MRLLHDLGVSGVNVDKSPMELDETELKSAQNAIKDVASRGIKNRPGHIALNTDLGMFDLAVFDPQVFNVTTNVGSILGGIGVPILNQSVSGVSFVFIGRG